VLATIILQNGRSLLWWKCRSSEKLGQVFMLEKDRALGPSWFFGAHHSGYHPSCLGTSKQGRASGPVPFSYICKAPAENF